MGIKSILSKPLSQFIVSQQQRWMADAENTQKRVFQSLISKATHTEFGKEHGFGSIKNHANFAKQVPIRDYEGLKDYVELLKAGKSDILWPGKPAYFAKTSGTTSGVKYIPITNESIAYQIAGARDALLNYIYHTGRADFIEGNLMFLSGSPEMKKVNGIYVGRLSGIVNHHVPAYLRRNQMPSYTTNCMEDWEAKLDQIVSETIEKPMSLISGIPPWVQMYFDKIQARTGKSIQEVFPQFSLFVYGGVNFEPYRKKLFDSIGKPIDSIETFPASEGFFAFQNQIGDPSLLLLLNSGIFYEFIPLEEYFSVSPTRLTIDEVELDKNYAMVISTNAGLWAYSIGDTIKFVSKNPYKILVTGRIKHFISAFGEHVIGEEVERAMKETLAAHNEVEIVEFTVAPKVATGTGNSYHEWFIAFSKLPNDIEKFALDLNASMVKTNTYYADLILGNVLSKLKIVPLKEDAFIAYMKSQGKLGGQNKVPRLSNDRALAEGLEDWVR